MKSLILQVSLGSCYILPLHSKHIAQLPGMKYLQSNIERPYQYKGKIVVLYIYTTIITLSNRRQKGM
jgi:hypothetical protein